MDERLGRALRDKAFVRGMMQSTLPEILLRIKACDERQPPDYDERYELVLMALSVAQQAGYKAGVRMDPDPVERHWPVAMIELPDGFGQVSWHIPEFPAAWDGHTTEEKYRRIVAYAEANKPVPLEEVKHAWAARDAHQAQLAAEAERAEQAAKAAQEPEAVRRWNAFQREQARGDIV